MVCTYYAGTLREYCLIARSECHRSALMRNTHRRLSYTILSPQRVVSTVSHLLSIPSAFLISWTVFFINTTHNNKLVKMTCYSITHTNSNDFSRFIPSSPTTSKIRSRSMFPLNGITDMSILSSDARDPMLFCRWFIWWALFHNIFSSPAYLQILTRYRMDR